MSQLASAYVLPSSALDALSKSLDSKDFSGFWSCLQNKSGFVVPAFEYSGSVVDIMLTFWEEREISFPLDLPSSASKEFYDVGLGLRVCCGFNSARSLAEQLTNEKNDPGELNRYFEEFTCEDWNEASVAMQSAKDFVLSGLKSVQDDSQYYLLFIG